MGQAPPPRKRLSAVAGAVRRGVLGMPGVRELINAQMIAGRVETLAAEIAAAWPGPEPKRIILVAVLKGSFVFAADLMRALARNGAGVRVEFLWLASYGLGTKSSRDVRLKGPLPEGIAGRPVLLIDDVLDTGHSLRRARDLLLEQGAAPVKICVLIDKPARREVEVTADYVGFTVPNCFVVGYGIDRAEEHRELPYVGAVEDEISGRQ
jgi:hypoxanthine phosphoribosyltransferase